MLVALLKEQSCIFGPGNPAAAAVNGVFLGGGGRLAVSHMGVCEID